MNGAWRIANRHVDLLLVTSTRTVPEPGEPKDPRASFEAHRKVDPRVPFHWWVDADGHGVLRVREQDEPVMPDGLFGPSIALRAEVVCVAGWYSAHRAPALGEPFLRAAAGLTHGDATGLDRPSVERTLLALLTALVREHGLERADVLLLSEVGSLAYPGDAIERAVRKWRGDEDTYTPEGRYYVLGPRLEGVDELRQALTALGHTASAEGAWTALDQAALIAFQTERHIAVTGYIDLVTRAAIREALDERKARAASRAVPAAL